MGRLGSGPRLVSQLELEPRLVGRIGTGPRLVGRLGSGPRLVAHVVFTHTGEGLSGVETRKLSVCPSICPAESSIWSAGSHGKCNQLCHFEVMDNRSRSQGLRKVTYIVHERNHTFFKVCDNVAQEVGRLHTENFADDDVNLQR